MKSLTKDRMLNGLAALDRLLKEEVTLIVGGGGAMILAHGFPLSTYDIDAVPKGKDFAELDALVKMVAKECELPIDWLNPYYGTFSHTLPSDYAERLVRVFSGKFLVADALGKEEMLIMKCFAGRQKDVAHAKALIKSGVNLSIVDKQISLLLTKGISGAEKALNFFEDVQDQ